MPSASIAVARAKICNASASFTSRMLTLRQMASSAIMTTERIWTTLSRRSAITRWRFLEFERNDNRKDHVKYGLENRVVRRIETSGQSQAEENLQAQVPDSYHEDDGDQCRQDHD